MKSFLFAFVPLFVLLLWASLWSVFGAWDGPGGGPLPDFVVRKVEFAVRLNYAVTLPARWAGEPTAWFLGPAFWAALPAAGFVLLWRRVRRLLGSDSPVRQTAAYPGA